MVKPISLLLLGCLGLALNGCSTQTPPAPRPTSSKPAPQKVEPTKPTSDEPKVILPPSPGISQRPAVREFIADMSRKHGFSNAELTRGPASPTLQTRDPP